MPSQRYSNGPSNGAAIIDGLDGDNPNRGVSGSIDEWLAASGLAAGNVPVGFAAGAFGTGSQARMLVDKLTSGRQRVDVRDFDVDVTGNNSSTAGFRAALAQVPRFGSLYIPPPPENAVTSWPKMFYVLDDDDDDGHCLTLPHTDITIFSDKSFRVPLLYCPSSGKNILFSEYKNFSVLNIGFYGDGDIFHGGSGATNTAIKFRETAGKSDVDGIINSCEFFGFFRAADIAGRNFEYSDNLHAGNQQALYAEPCDPAAEPANADTLRGLRVYRNRFHSSGEGLWFADVTSTTATGSTTTVIKLDAADAGTTDLYRGRVLIIGSEERVIISNDATAKTVTLKQALTAGAPSSGVSYTIKSAHGRASMFWVEPGTFSGSYEYGNQFKHNQMDQGVRFYVGPIRRSAVTDNFVYSVEGGKLSDNLGAITILASSTGSTGSAGGEVSNNQIHSYDSGQTGDNAYTTNSYGIQCFAELVKISGNNISGFQRYGIRLESTSTYCKTFGNSVEGCSGENAGGFDAYYDVGVENDWGPNFVSTPLTGSRRHRYGINLAGTRTRLRSVPWCQSGSTVSGRVNVGAGVASRPFATSLTPDTTAYRGDTFEVGSYLELLTPVAGQPYRTNCTVPGTIGTLSITATAAASTSLTLVSDTTLLVRGQYLLIAGDATPRTIGVISGSTVTLNTATTASGSGLAVSWSPPTFDLNATVTRSVAIPLTSWRKGTARNTALATTASGGDLCLINTPAGSAIVDLATNNTSLTTTMQVEPGMPQDYSAGGAVTIKMRAKLSVARAVGATITISAKRIGDGTVGSELYAGSAVTLTTSYAEYAFPITATSLSAADYLALIPTIVNNDTGGSTNGVVGISKTWIEYAAVP